MKIDGWMKMLFDSLYDGILIIDADAVVSYVNPAYTRITKVLGDDIVGRPLKNVRPGARLADVLDMKKPIVGALRREDGIDYIANMSPLIENDQVVGGISVVSRFEDVARLSEKIVRYQSQVEKLEARIKTFQSARYTLDSIVAEDMASLQIKEQIRRIAEKDTTILLIGESGTGKELYAQALHNLSDRKNQPFVAVNCATFQGSLLESELFGYAEGAFTGAKKEGKMGLFEAADMGTVFLDEVSEMDMETQGKMLRVLQEGMVRRVGDVKEIPVNIRVIAATNRNLEKRIEEGLFRSDLYYRIAVYPIRIPPLRQRREDILPIAHTFMEQYKNEVRGNIMLSKEAGKLLYEYSWPGNIRELRNAVEYAASVMEDAVIREEDLPEKIIAAGGQAGQPQRLDELIKSMERKEIEKALKLYGSDMEGKKRAARELGISLASLYNKMKP